MCRSASPPPSRGGRASSSPPPKSPQSPRRTGRSELTPKLQLEAEADRLLMIKQVSKQVICHFSQIQGAGWASTKSMPKMHAVELLKL